MSSKSARKGKRVKQRWSTLAEYTNKNAIKSGTCMVVIQSNHSLLGIFHLTLDAIRECSAAHEDKYP
jgi:hypothetical protein